MASITDAIKACQKADDALLQAVVACDNAKATMQQSPYEDRALVCVSWAHRAGRIREMRAEMRGDFS